MKMGFYHSTVFKIAALMFCISFMAIVSMFSSVFISDYAQTDARTINVAGSLRMQSFRMASEVANFSKVMSPEQAATLQQLIDTFEQDFNRGTLASHMAQADSDSLERLHHSVQVDWTERVKPALAATTNGSLSYDQLLNEIASFVGKLDSLVTGYQEHAERNIRRIRLIQISALFATLLMIAFAMLIVRHHIEQPLSALVEMARRIGQGDFTAKAEVAGEGELAVLASTMNQMSQSIYRSQSFLEQKVKTSTQALRQSNASLELLFKTSRLVNDMNPGNYNFNPIINQLATVTGISDLDLCITTPAGTQPFIHQMPPGKSLSKICLTQNCEDCLKISASKTTTAHELKYPLNKNDTNYGVLVVRATQSIQLDEWQHQLFESLAEQIATGLSMMQQQEQARRIALMTERTVIARELHDSLAQALSYLKIQVTLLQKLQQKDNVQREINNVIEELRNGLNSAYRELRELLTTFRLKLEGDSLKQTFEQTVAQFEFRAGQIEFSLDYQVNHIPFTPQEEIHMLQIAREAMQNAIHHSQGSNIWLSLVEQQHREVNLVITDDGIGIPRDPSKLHHYGLAIIQERSRSLGGNVTFNSLEAGGTEVRLRFIPEYARGEQAAPREVAQHRPE